MKSMSIFISIDNSLTCLPVVMNGALVISPGKASIIAIINIVRDPQCNV